jgi:hypothetical protein
MDGVPSMHDPKAAVVLARLQAIKPGPEWKPAAEGARDVRALLDSRWPLSKSMALFHGHLESMLARHFPEFTQVVDVHGQRSWMALLGAFPCPQAIAASAVEAAATLWRASRGRLSRATIEAIVDSARNTLGVPMTSGEQVRLRSLVEQIQQLTEHIDAIDVQLGRLVDAHDVMKRLAAVVGPACAASIIAHIGCPTSFASAGALEKAMGLNLKERSSGEKKGKLTITKRGPGQVRQLLYLAALRVIMGNTTVFAWYRGRSAHRAGLKTKAVVAVMRKLARALWHVARGAEFEAKKLFDERRLDLEAVREPTKTHPFERKSSRQPQHNSPARAARKEGDPQSIAIM